REDWGREGVQKRETGGIESARRNWPKKGDSSGSPGRSAPGIEKPRSGSGGIAGPHPGGWDRWNLGLLAGSGLALIGRSEEHAVRNNRAVNDGSGLPVA